MARPARLHRAEDVALKTYVVGGAVRDELLALPVADRDHVVVGATPEEMVRAGFRPVGKDFPVFLHPTTGEEYALARTERKTARGYKGFSIHAAPDVTLEQDLARRDLTINAMARDERGVLIDPWHGERDLRAGILRHVSPAFAEDPVRILRVARFAARFGFAVAPETLALMRRMAASGEVDALVPERVWQELARGLMEPSPRRMFAVLDECGALERVLPEWRRLDARRALAALDCAAARLHPLPIRLAVLFAGVDETVAASACERLRAPQVCRDLALLVARLALQVAAAHTLDAEGLLAFLVACDAFRRPERFAMLLDAVDCIAVADGRRDFSVAARRATRAFKAASGVDAGAVARAHPDDVARAVRRARLAAVESALPPLAPRSPA
jgi:tRNA nucleotidyltransferase (CCA-adding enzyme)